MHSNSSKVQVCHQGSLQTGALQKEISSYSSVIVYFSLPKAHGRLGHCIVTSLFRQKPLGQHRKDKTVLLSLHLGDCTKCILYIPMQNSGRL